MNWTPPILIQLMNYLVEGANCENGSGALDACTDGGAAGFSCFFGNGR